MYKNIIIVFLLFINISFVAGYFFSTQFSIVHKNQVSEVREKGSYQFINPLLECNANYEYYNPKKLQDRLESYIDESILEGKVTSVSYYTRILQGGAAFGYNLDEKYVPASLIKIPLAIALLKNFSFNELEARYLIDESFEVLQRNFGKDVIQEGKEYSIRELLDAMIIHSDNLATSAIIEILGADLIYEIYDQLGLEAINFDDINSINIGVQNYASFLRVLYNSSLISREASEYILSLMERSTFKIGLKSSLPISTPVANKFGERYELDTGKKQMHDCGIIYRKNFPYVLCVMTKGNDFDAQLEVIQNISKLSYDDMKKNLP